MPIRHHDETDYIVWLKSLGCQVYAPLDNPNNIKNLINGEDIIPYSSDNMQWSDSEQMFLFKKASGQYSSTSGYFAKFVLDGTYSTKEYTALADIKSLYTGTYTQCWDMLPTRYGLVFDTTYNNIVKSVYRFTIINDSTGAQYRFKDGIQTLYSEYSPQPTVTYDTIRIACPNNSTNLNLQFYIKNFMFFNQSLDLDTIKKIQGI